MRLTETFELAIKNLFSNKFRSVLTMLGIIIGVGAVIVITALGNGMEMYVRESFESMGTNVLNLNVMGRGTSRTLDVDEMYDFVDENGEYFNSISPVVSVSATSKLKSEELTASIKGVGEDYDTMNSITVSEGRFIKYVDISELKRVCVVGSYVASEYFNSRAIGESIKMNGEEFVIIGVLEKKSTNEESSEDDVIYIPYSRATKLSQNSSISSYSLDLVSEENVEESKSALESFLTDKFGDTNSFRISSMSELLDNMTSMIGMIVTVLATIAAISLVVGGIGIMNITLVSVSERTREIGIRKSLGAKNIHILQQFIIEAATTSSIGGLLGIGLGFLISSVASNIIVKLLNYDLSLVPSLSSVLIAFGVSVSIGILFGFLPAKTAAKLNPIDALRYE